VNVWIVFDVVFILEKAVVEPEVCLYEVLLHELHYVKIDIITIFNSYKVIVVDKQSCVSLIKLSSDILDVLVWQELSLIAIHVKWLGVLCLSFLKFGIDVEDQLVLELFWKLIYKLFVAIIIVE